MKNQIYRIRLSESKDKDLNLEFYIAETNDVEPYREKLCLGVLMMDGEVQMDAALDEDELESLIDYLRNCSYAINKFNKESKPKEVQA